MLWRGDIRGKACFVEETILDKTFRADVKELSVVIKGPYDVLREADKDVHYLSRMSNLACRLPDFVRSTPLTADQRDNLLRDVGNKTDMLLNPIHAVARPLDPMLRDITVFSNVDLMAQSESVVERLIGKKGSSRFDDCMDQLYESQFGRGVFDTPKAKKRVEKDNAVLGWEANGAGRQEIWDVALKVLSIWTTSSPTERNLSTWALVQTKSRNKSLRFKSRGEDEPTIAAGWLGFTTDWEDEDLGGDMANVTEVVDDIEVAGEGTASAVGSTNIRHDPTTSSISRWAHRLVQVEEAEDADEADENNEDDVPDEKWVDERSDSYRSWTRKEDIVPYVEEQQRPEQRELHDEDEQPAEEHREQQQEEQQEQQQEKQTHERSEEQQLKQQQGDEEQQQHDRDEEQQQQREKEQRQQRVDPADQQETGVQSAKDVHGEGEAEGEHGRSEVQGFYGSSLQSPVVGRHGAHPGRVWDPAAYCAPRG
ncbi:hypothetical protein CBR_g37729 [Chara braunii]|uniref:DUF659 domain-containing protein n=1 Tax=Chara braunii TaxID=69332 RepID=A0A388JZX7_CHABU|nr:hypothetical protein CBR_g37729 [Chara braunii]|eukprot:GBG63371.1 hypothetical protein CBR_g37729 [Chara braunii]